MWNAEDEAKSYVENRHFLPTCPYIRGSIIGNGGYSVVYKVLRRTDGQVFAGKASQIQHQLRNEARALKSMKHKHILRYVDLYEEPGNPVASLVVTELCLEGNLQQHIDNISGSLDRENILRVTRQIADALSYLHTHGQFHSDVKPANILIRKLEPIDVALADCADVKSIGTTAKVRSTRVYRSPETAELERYAGAGDDIWALGVTMLSMAAQMPRFEATDKGIRAFPMRCLEHVGELVRLNPGHGVVYVISQLVVEDASQRASASECSRLAQECLAGKDEQLGHQDMTDGNDGSLGIRSPEEFQPRAFW